MYGGLTVELIHVHVRSWKYKLTIVLQQVRIGQAGYVPSWVRPDQASLAVLHLQDRLFPNAPGRRPTDRTKEKGSTRPRLGVGDRC